MGCDKPETEIDIMVECSQDKPSPTWIMISVDAIPFGTKVRSRNECLERVNETHVSLGSNLHQNVHGGMIDGIENDENELNDKV